MAIAHLATGYWGQRRALDKSFIKGVQVLITIIALAIMAPQIGTFKTILAILWLITFIAASSLMGRFGLSKLPARSIAVLGILIAQWDTDSLNVMLIRTFKPGFSLSNSSNTLDIPCIICCFDHHFFDNARCPRWSFRCRR